MGIVDIVQEQTAQEAVRTDNLRVRQRAYAAALAFIGCGAVYGLASYASMPAMNAVKYASAGLAAGVVLTALASLRRK
ncbi:hypothetical protein HY642_03070 [Candidatus Woesearchaeota archaeon]|nr:hypothetical protein [Candidatus Woesearchaeota archaeon]